jgi:ribosomal peptide maturation radical SAM protein 1
MILERAESAEAKPGAPVRLALVNMPFAMADRPSIQCGLLKSELVRAGCEVDVFYLNLELAAELGAGFYHEVAHLRTDLLLGEWLFSVAAFGPRANEEEYRSTCPDVAGVCRRLDIDFAELCRLRTEALPAWVAGWCERTDWSRYAAVGFTSTFEQNAPSFALARAIKARYPEVKTLFGGANFDGTMGREYVRALPFIDYAVTGEADHVLPQLIERIAQGRCAAGLPGVLARHGGEVPEAVPGPLVRDLDALPVPDYDEYFATLFRLGHEKVLGTQAPLLLVETARGCWWGEKQHCTFCGLNNNGMKFRSKSPELALEQFDRLSTRYQIVNFEAVDNIMDYQYLEKLCGPLSEGHFDYRIFYEVKANLSPAQLRVMSRAGINAIQPGIESLSSHILSLMRKGITMLRNVRLLKWAYYYGMRVGWNILTGFPGETQEDYDEQVRLAPLLRHLPPPADAGRIWMERFSPYFFDRSFPVSNLRPLPVYRLIYPEEVRLDEIAYFFQYEMGSTLPEECYRPLRQQVLDWKAAWEKRPRPSLVYQRAPEWLQIVDQRGATRSAHAFHGVEAAIYEHCGETERTVESLQKHLVQSLGKEPPAEQVREALANFCDLGLMLEEKGRFLSLALPVNPHW